MQKVNVPNEYQQVMPYLILNDAAKFLEFAQNVLGATEKMKHLRDDQTIMHAEIFVGESVIMVAQATEEWTAMPAGLFIYVPDADETYKKALAAGATSLMEPRDQDYGRSGGVLDHNGNSLWFTSVK